MGRGRAGSLADLASTVGEHSAVDRKPNNNTSTASSGGNLIVDPKRVAANPRNPRKNLGNLEDLADIRTVQYNAVLVVTLAAYLALWPEDADQVGDCDWVVAAGDRRRAATLQYQCKLEISVKDQVARSKSSFMAVTLGENIRRESLDPIDEARGIDELARELGSGEAAAEVLDQSAPWVSKRRSLLKLIPDLQEKYRAKELSLKMAEKLWGANAEDQMARWRFLTEEAEEARDAKRRETLAARKAKKQADTPAPVEPDREAVVKDPTRVLEKQIKAVRRLFTTAKVDAPTVATAILDEYGEDGYKAVIAKWEERHR